MKKIKTILIGGLLLILIGLSCLASYVIPKRILVPKETVKHINKNKYH